MLHHLWRRTINSISTKNVLASVRRGKSFAPITVLLGIGTYLLSPHTKAKEGKVTTITVPVGKSETVVIRLDEFAKRQWETDFKGVKINIPQQDFMEVVRKAMEVQKVELIDGYAPFCKHIFVENFIKGIKVSSLNITEKNEHLLKSDYVARTEKELPVLVRWFPRETVNVPDAKYLDLILYSKEQIDQEKKMMGDPEIVENYDWGIISIKPQVENFETPMDPITIMRNALGKEEGGSGVPLNKKKYLESVLYWRKHAPIK